jgi:rubrerythrin
VTQETEAPAVQPEESIATWRCKTCQFLVKSPTLPFRCPRCGASRVKFEQWPPKK